MKKRILSLLLALCMVLCLIPAVAPQAQAMSLQQLQAKFPTGYYWNHYVSSTYDAADYLMQVWNESFANTITTSQCASHSNGNLNYYVGKYDCNFFDGGMQCCGFARKLGYDAYGSRPSGWGVHYNIYGVKPGDVVHYTGAGADATYGHWVFVYAVSGSTVTVGECNVDGQLCKIKWGRSMNLASASGVTIYSAPYALPTTIESLDVGDDFYARIKSVSAGKYLTDSGNNAVISQLSGEYSQIWYFDRQADGTYVISAGATGRVLDVSDASAAQNANVQTWDYNGSNAQKWYLTGDANGYAFHAMCTGCVIDVYNNEIADGTNVIMWTASGNSNQKFTIEPVTGLSPAPGISTDRTVYPLGAAVNVSWNSVPCITHYWFKVFKDSASGTELISQSTQMNRSFSFTPTETGTYVLYVEACRSSLGCGQSRHVTITVKNPGELFTDVKEGEWFYKPVQWAVANKITAGTSDTTFSPNDPCTRGQVVTFLYRAAGSPAVSGSNPFADVKSGDYFYNAVLWAVQNGITQGTSATFFSPDDPCTRAQVATFLWRSKGKPLPRDLSSPFKDVPTSQYYYLPVVWAYYEDITKGDGAANTFNPNGKCTRAQIVTFMHRAEA